jgi:hypothetical protein
MICIVLDLSVAWFGLAWLGLGIVKLRVGVSVQGLHNKNKKQ